MSRRFQFSLARSLIAVGLLCAALVIGRRAIGFDYIPHGLLVACAASIPLAASVGAITRREVWLVIGAAIGAGTCVLYMYEYAWQIRAGL
jgi:hypothetical protein